MKNFKFELKNKVVDNELFSYFNLMKSHLINLYGEEAVSEENYEIWKENRKKTQKNRFYIKIFKDGELCGFADLLITDENTLYFSDIIVREDMRKTFLVLEFIKFVFECKEFKNFNEIYFHINRNNLTSLKTFGHLGYEITGKTEKSNRYKLTRENIERYLKRIFKN